MIRIPKIKLRPGTGAYAKGQARALEILEAALDLLVDQGYRAMSMRRIAAACGITLGNVTYYYPTKDALVRDLLDGVLATYEDAFDHIRQDPSLSPQDQLVAIIQLLLDDIQTKKTTHLFPELWALANHDPFIADRVDELYRRVRVVLNELIAILNPALTPDERETVALFVSASLEGTTMFAGHNKPWGPRMPWIEGIAAKALLDLVITITGEDIRRLDKG